MKLLKKNIKWIILIIALIIITSGISVYATSTYFANQVIYKENQNVEDALNDLYNDYSKLNTNNLKLIKGTDKINTTIGKKYLIVFNVTSLTSQAYTPSLVSGFELLKETDIISASFSDYIYKTKSFIVKATAEQITVSGSMDLYWNSISYYEF